MHALGRNIGWYFPELFIFILILSFCSPLNPPFHTSYLPHTKLTHNIHTGRLPFISLYLPPYDPGTLSQPSLITSSTTARIP